MYQASTNSSGTGLAGRGTAYLGAEVSVASGRPPLDYAAQGLGNRRRLVPSQNLGPLRLAFLDRNLLAILLSRDPLGEVRFHAGAAVRECRVGRGHLQRRRPLPQSSYRHRGVDVKGAPQAEVVRRRRHVLQPQILDKLDVDCVIRLLGGGLKGDGAALDVVVVVDPVGIGTYAHVYVQVPGV